MDNKIAALNDAFRSEAGMPRFNPGVKGRVFVTPGIAGLPPQKQIEVWFAVARFSAFEDGNDPYGEHDFGAIDIEGAGKVFWKIDCYADEAMNEGCEDPADPVRSFRVLTIMLASEY